MARVTPAPLDTLDMDTDAAVSYAGMAFGMALMVVLYLREKERDEMLVGIKRNTDQLVRGQA